MTDRRRRSWGWCKWAGLALSMVLLAGWSIGTGWVAGYAGGGRNAFVVGEGAVGVANHPIFAGTHPIIAGTGWFLERDTELSWIFWPVMSPSSFCIPLWIPLLPSVLLTTIAWRRARVPVLASQCAKCGYDRSGLLPASPCPECGAAAEGVIPASR